MDPLDLDALRSVLEPLDLTPLIAVVGGEHLHGIAGPDSEVRIRILHSDALGASLGGGRRTDRVTLELVDRAVSIRIVSDDLKHAARSLAKGDERLIEEVHSNLVLLGEDALARLRPIAREFVTRDMIGHYEKLARAGFARIEAQTVHRVRPLLATYRALLAGFRLATTGEVEPDLRRLLLADPVPQLGPLIDRGRPAAVLGDPALYGFLLGHAHELSARFERAAERAILPAEPPGEDRLDEFLSRSGLG